MRTQSCANSEQVVSSRARKISARRAPLASGDCVKLSSIPLERLREKDTAYDNIVYRYVDIGKVKCMIRVRVGTRKCNIHLCGEAGRRKNRTGTSGPKPLSTQVRSARPEGVPRYGSEFRSAEALRRPTAFTWLLCSSRPVCGSTISLHYSWMRFRLHGVPEIIFCNQTSTPRKVCCRCNRRAAGRRCRCAAGRERRRYLVKARHSIARPARCRDGRRGLHRR